MPPEILPTSTARTKLTPPPGLLLVDKPIGPTSHDVVARARNVLGTKKIGHAGTLDPMASGLLILGIERGTKLLGHLALKDKSYVATIRLGQATSTEDAEGEIIASADAAAITREQILAAMKPLTGDLMQVPSSVSAIKVDGKRAYDRVRSGEEVVLKARPVTIGGFHLLGDPRVAGEVLDIDVKIDCSTGTYVRALARDLGDTLGVGAHLTALRRTRIGQFNLAAAADIYGAQGVPVKSQLAKADRPPRARIDPAFAQALIDRIVAPARVARATFPIRLATEAEETAIGYGRTLTVVGIQGVYAMLDHSGERFLALVEEQSGLAKTVLVWQAS